MRTTFLLFTFLLTTFVLMACDIGDNDEEAYALTLHEESLQDEYALDDFTLDAIELELEDPDGTTTIIQLTESMLEGEIPDTTGTHELTATFQGASVTFTIDLVEVAQDELTLSLMTLFEAGTVEGLIETDSYEEWLESIRGEDGIGIEDALINAEGELILHFTDNESLNLGRVRGEDGMDGADGEDGADGVDGEDGTDGQDGREVEFRQVDQRLEWRYEGEDTWQELFDFSPVAEEETHTVRFVEPWTMTEVFTEEIPHGEEIILSSIQTIGYEFSGWYHDRQYNYELELYTPIFDDLTVYAKWLPTEMGGFEVREDDGLNYAVVTGDLGSYDEHLFIPERIMGLPV